MCLWSQKFIGALGRDLLAVPRSLLRFLWACNQSYEKSLLFLFFFIAESRRDHVATTIPTSWSEKPSVQTHPYPHLQFRYNFRKQLLFPQKLFLVLSQTQSYLCYFKRVESKWDFVNASTAIWHFRNVCWHADKAFRIVSLRDFALFFA